MDKLLSIIVPVYNVGLYLEECIESIIKQTYACLEIILVDDGSTDGSGEICDKYAIEDKRIKVIHKKNGGLISARKAGIQAAAGEYVTYVDGDDWIELDLYEKILSVIESAACDIMCCGYKWNKGNECEIITNLAEDGEYKEDIARKKLILGLFCNETTMRGTINYCVWSKIFRRELLYKNLLEMREDYAFGEDAVCTLACVLDSKNIVVNNNICGYHYRWNEESITNKYDAKFFEHSLALYSEIDRIIEERRCSELEDHARKYKLYIMMTGITKIIDRKSNFSLVQQYNYFKRLSKSEVFSEMISYYEAEQIPMGKKLRRMYALLKKGQLKYMVLAGKIPYKFYVERTKF